LQRRVAPDATCGFRLARTADHEEVTLVRLATVTANHGGRWRNSHTRGGSSVQLRCASRAGHERFSPANAMLWIGDAAARSFPIWSAGGLQHGDDPAGRRRQAAHRARTGPPRSSAGSLVRRMGLPSGHRRRAALRVGDGRQAVPSAEKVTRYAWQICPIDLAQPARSDHDLDRARGAREGSSANGQTASRTFSGAEARRS